MRTDLALERRESIQGDREIHGVILEEETCADGKIKVSTVEIKNDHGSKVMGKPKGTYITVEVEQMNEKDVIRETIVQLKKLLDTNKKKKILVTGLGNREITPDALGPWTIDQLFVTRHLIQEYGEVFQKRNQMRNICAIAPGVMAQTGMEAKEILQGVVEKIKPDVVIVIDALAARSVRRLNRTIQLTNTGISPGAGVGNNRKALNRETLGVEVIAIGVPTVVDAETIVEDRVEESLRSAGFTQKECELFVNGIRGQKTKNMFVTSKDVDEEVKQMSYILSEVVNRF